MLLFVGQIPFEETDRESFQEIDYRRMFAPARQMGDADRHAERIPEIVAHAVDVATTGRPGPVVIALSEEMQKRVVEVPDLPRAPVCRAASRSGGDGPDAAMLAKAQRPLALLGGSCWTDGGARGAPRFPRRQQPAGRGRLSPSGDLRRHS